MVAGKGQRITGAWRNDGQHGMDGFPARPWELTASVPTGSCIIRSAQPFSTDARQAQPDSEHGGFILSWIFTKEQEISDGHTIIIHGEEDQI
ncbi:hypothetical protein QOZ95_003156 [Paenibacillus brasilensis]|uniref:Uncharacterized protein n=1 Tax=Paenibacillus brasilensis TaxID=128574 RepID=A0ABU0L2Q0_9BACL|nr:hypothetical protein [Paenibacillus brasilensis]